jgi:hypothetical protein
VGGGPPRAAADRGGRGERSTRLAVETGQPHWTGANQLAQAVAASAAGDDAAADALAQQTEALYLASGSTSMLGFVEFARGRGAVINQRYAAGLAHLRRIIDPADPLFHPFVGTWGLADLTEAAAAVGEPAQAQAYLDQLESLAAQTTGPLLLAQAAYARPLAAEDGQAEPLYQAALEEGLAGWPDYRARMLLRYGEWLRRQRRTAQSRVPLREARASLDALGFTHLAERARLELRAAGEWSSRREPAALGRADRPGAADCADGRRRHVQPGDRRATVHLAPYRGCSPVQDLPEARHNVPQPAARGTRLKSAPTPGTGITARDCPG